MKHRAKLKIAFSGLVFFMFYQACWPPFISDENVEKTTNVSSIYFDVSKVVHRPILVTGEITASFFIDNLGGFYFLQDLYSNKSIICFTSKAPPQDGSRLAILGTVKPIIQGDNVKLLYLKTKKFYPLYFDRKDHAAAL